MGKNKRGGYLSQHASHELHPNSKLFQLKLNPKQTYLNLNLSPLKIESKLRQQQIDRDVVEQLDAFGAAYKTLLLANKNINDLVHDTNLHSKLAGCYGAKSEQDNVTRRITTNKFDATLAFHTLDNKDLHKLFSIGEVAKPVRDFMLRNVTTCNDDDAFDDELNQQHEELMRIIENITKDKETINKYMIVLIKYQYVFDKSTLCDIFYDHKEILAHGWPEPYF